MKKTREEQEKDVFLILTKINEFKPTTMEYHDATDEEVRFFIEAFMERTMTINNEISSYGLKHICERALSKVFYKDYNDLGRYTTNEQFKRVMEQLGFKKKIGIKSENEFYGFAWRFGAQGVMQAFGMR